MFHIELYEAGDRELRVPVLLTDEMFSHVVMNVSRRFLLSAIDVERDGEQLRGHVTLTPPPPPPQPTLAQTTSQEFKEAMLVAADVLENGMRSQDSMWGQLVDYLRQVSAGEA